MTSEILSLLTSAANKYNVPPELAIAVAQQESGGNPSAVSPAGAQGVMQLMPSTASSLGVTDPFDPTQNIDAGVQYLSQMLSEFNGDPSLALAAYNWGPGNVSQNGYANWPAETSNYVGSIMAQVGDLFAPAASSASTEVSDDASESSFTPSTPELVAMALGGGLLLYFLTA